MGAWRQSAGKRSLSAAADSRKKRPKPGSLAMKLGVSLGRRQRQRHPALRRQRPLRPLDEQAAVPHPSRWRMEVPIRLPPAELTVNPAWGACYARRVTRHGTALPRYGDDKTPQEASSHIHAPRRMRRLPQTSVASPVLPDGTKSNGERPPRPGGSIVCTRLISELPPCCKGEPATSHGPKDSCCRRFAQAVLVLVPPSDQYRTSAGVVERHELVYGIRGGRLYLLILPLHWLPSNDLAPEDLSRTPSALVRF